MRRAESVESKLSRLSKAEGDCLVWTGCVDFYGYGQISVGHSKKLKAHREAWALANGPIPAGMFVCHTCDNPRCIKPAHMFLGTPADNVADMIRKGRSRTGTNFAGMFGEDNPQSKLTDAQVDEIKKLFGSMPQWKLAAMFGVSRATIWRAALRQKGPKFIPAGKTRRRLSPAMPETASAPL